MTVFSAMGILITSAALVIYPNVPVSVLWDPVQLIGQFKQPIVIAVSMFTVAVATLSVNIAANVVSPANDFANAFPRWITFKSGGLITGIFGILMQPWKLVADPHGYIFQWLVGYSGGLGSIAGVLIVDYWVIRKTRLCLTHLYLADGDYRYDAGWNWRAVMATSIGCFLAWIGAFYQPLKIVFDNGCAPNHVESKLLEGALQQTDTLPALPDRFQVAHPFSEDMLGQPDNLLEWVMIPSALAGTWSRNGTVLLSIRDELTHRETHPNTQSFPHGTFIRGFQIDSSGNIWDCPRGRRHRFETSSDGRSAEYIIITGGRQMLVTGPDSLRDFGEVTLVDVDPGYWVDHESAAQRAGRA
ncbi:unnamed protein product [Sphagnum jensenii]|uniref:Uncharacterized protein n=1 Tax=Sphagnum jensenii TaxID=128206 RepID=A0ABP0VC76_9BRYO